MSGPQVNGDISGAHSAFLDHILGYPVVSDGVKTFKTNEYGQKSLQLGDSAYKTFAAPVIPYLSKPYEYVSPYVVRADSFGDQTLGKLDERFPAIRKPTSELYSDTKGLILLPYNKAFEGRDHVFDVWATELKKGEQQGIIGYGKAAVTTALVVSNETLSWLSSFISAKKAQANHAVNEKANN